MPEAEKLARDLVFGQEKEQAYQEIKKQSQEAGIKLASIHDFYMAAGKGEVFGLTVPAINIRGLTFDFARTLFQVIKEKKIGPVIFEIAKSEMGYTIQDPREYVGVIMAAALAEEYQGPLFIQGDHFQVKTKAYQEDPQKTVDEMKEFITKAVEAGFYNIDVDTSTLVDLSKPTVKEQQENNYKVCAELTKHIREIQPAGVEVSVGGEIGEIGEKNSTPEELRAYLDGYKELLGEGMVGISKVSVQTGTSHGGVVLPDGSIAKVAIDFETLQELSNVACKEYGLGGAVQHGASTLPDEAFGKFPETGTIEVHLATGFQNIVLDSENFPAELREKMYQYIKTELADENKEGQTEEQFIYKMRKKTFGPFKQELWDLPVETRQKVMAELKEKFIFIFEKLNVNNTQDLLNKYIS